MKKKKRDHSVIGNTEFENRNQRPGTLYIVSTPIGNLEDITLRALRVLKSVELIAAESVKHSRGLCQHYGIKTKVASYHQHNQKVKGPGLIRKLRLGADIALVSSAGTPGISDPGSLLITQAIEANIRVSPVPGPSAVTAALSVAGIKTDRFLFLGFLSNRAGKRRKELRNLSSEPHAMVFLEAPHRLHDMLTDVGEILGDRQIVLLKELTKVYEEVKRGTVSSILEELDTDGLRGEFTLVVAGGEKDRQGRTLAEETRKKIERLLKEEKMSTKDIAAKLSTEEGYPYRAVYRECIAIRRVMKMAQGH